MQEFHAKHNANLPHTVPESTPIVNYIERLGEGSCHYDVSLAPNKLFVKIPNSIFEFHLKPRLLEFYCLLSYLCYSAPEQELPILTIRSEIIRYTNIKINKDSINTYLNYLQQLGLIKRIGKFYTITPNPHLPRRCGESPDRVPSILSPRSNLRVISTEVAQITSKVNRNNYTQPKANYTPFYITIYNQNTKQGSMALEFYFASKLYNKHHPDKVCSDLNISRKTYYTYLQDLITKKIVLRHKLNYKTYHYTNDYRIILHDDSVSVMEARYDYRKLGWEEDKQRKLELQRSKAKIGELLTDYKTPHSRLWFKSSMARIMQEYGINYIKSFDTWDPKDAYLIVQELEQQYRISGTKLTAAIIVKGIQNAYNWTKIIDRIHAKRKREEHKEYIRSCNSRYFMDYI
jgi:hypothetical protein